MGVQQNTLPEKSSSYSDGDGSSDGIIYEKPYFI